jgi:PAS domain S-box-containing protein
MSTPSPEVAMLTGSRAFRAGDPILAIRGQAFGLRHAPVLAAWLSIAMGATAFLGWTFGIDTLKSIIPGLLTMKANTALVVILLGLGLLLRANGPDSSRGRRLMAIPVLAAIGLSAAVGSQYVTGESLGIDQWLFRELPGQVGTVQPNRMSPMTVLCSLAIGFGLLFNASPMVRRIVSWALVVAIAVASLNVFDFVIAAETPSVLAGSTQMALNTAVTMIILAFGTMATLPQGGPLEVFVGSSSSAHLARRLFVASLVAPLALAWLRSRGEELGLYDARYGTSLMVFGTFAFLAAMVWQGARSARRIDAERLVALEERDRFFDVSPDLLVTASAAGYFERLNPAWTNTLGYSLKELSERPFVDFVHPDDIEATQREVERQVGEGRSVLNFQNRYRHRDGSYRWFEWTSAPSANGARLYAVARDITDRKLEEERLRAPAAALARRQAEIRERIQTIIDTEAFGPVYQPIVDLSSGATLGFEALTRFADGSRTNETFALAVECGLGIALERATMGAAARGARGLPRGPWLSLNVSPSLLADVEVLRATLGMRVRPLVLEVTEHETIAAYGPLRQAVVDLGPEVRLAVDDAGAGVANFNHLIELRPDFVKLDAGLVRGVDDDVSRQAVVAGILHFATAAGCLVIAEGIETQHELATLTDLGVPLGQGYLLARPAPVEAWSTPVPSPFVVAPPSQVRRGA